MDLQKMEELSNLRKEGKISIVEFEERMKALRYESAQEGNSDVKKSPFLNRVKRENEYFEWRRLVKLHPVCLALRYSPIFLLLCFMLVDIMFLWWTFGMSVREAMLPYKKYFKTGDVCDLWLAASILYW